ncbi:hypothetical protein Cgig2_026664 [Carnegiea gigantea]|uniref:Uncharacterized protein n=1 Tax=Carnegiea gigantea TaxID=171969 RepID=A0A9Q1Q7E2_9CARY|nr:hypothetical protein Cgig2_026664 [Carnegiea gigantea]
MLVMLGSVYKNKEGAVKYFVCSKEGSKQTSIKVNSTRKVKLTREGCDAMVGLFSNADEDKLISNPWLEFMDCMEIARRDPQKLTIALKGIREISKELKDSSGNTSDEKLRFHYPNSSAQKEVVSELREEKNRLLSNNKREGGFVNLVGANLP